MTDIYDKLVNDLWTEYSEDWTDEQAAAHLRKEIAKTHTPNSKIEAAAKKWEEIPYDDTCVQMAKVLRGLLENKR